MNTKKQCLFSLLNPRLQDIHATVRYAIQPPNTETIFYLINQQLLFALRLCLQVEL